MRAQVERKMAQKEKEKHEEKLREMAQKARERRAGIKTHVEKGMTYSLLIGFTLWTIYISFFKIFFFNCVQKQYVHMKKKWVSQK